MVCLSITNFLNHFSLNSWIFTMLQSKCLLSINHVVQIFAGVDEVNDGTKSLDDKLRIYYIGQHLLYVLRAIR